MESRKGASRAYLFWRDPQVTQLAADVQAYSKELDRIEAEETILLGGIEQLNQHLSQWHAAAEVIAEQASKLAVADEAEASLGLEVAQRLLQDLTENVSSQKCVPPPVFPALCTERLPHNEKNAGGGCQSRPEYGSRCRRAHTSMGKQHHRADHLLIPRGRSAARRALESGCNRAREQGGCTHAWAAVGGFVGIGLRKGGAFISACMSS